MMQKDISKSIIPDSKKEDGFRMVPKNIVLQINNKFKNIKEIYIDDEKKISIQNDHKDIVKYNHYEEMYIIIYNELYKLFNEIFFWKYNMNKRTCEHQYKNNLFCGKRVDIKCSDGLYKCGKHISTKIYKPKKKNINIEDRCIGKKGYKNRENCELKRKYGEHCIYHFKKVNNFKSINSAKLFYEEITLLNVIEVEQTNNSLNIKQKSIKNIREVTKNFINIELLNITRKIKNKPNKFICKYNEHGFFNNYLKIIEKEKLTIYNKKIKNSKKSEIFEKKDLNLYNKYFKYLNSEKNRYKNIFINENLEKMKKEIINYVKDNNQNYIIKYLYKFSLSNKDNINSTIFQNNLLSE